MPAKNNPLKTVDNNSAYAIVNAAYKQALGDTAVDTLTLDDFADGGVAFESLTLSRDKFTKALIDQVVNFYADTELMDDYEDPYYVEERRYASVCQMLSVRAPEAQESHAWKNLAPTTSGGVTTKVSIGTYEVNPPIVDATYFTKTVSWELPIAITGSQWDDAFKSADEIRGFVDVIFVAVENALRQHRKDMGAANRNAFMADKILYAGTVGAKGIHVINLLTEFNSQRGGQLATVADFFESPAACRFAAAQLQLYAKYLREQSTLFNTKQLPKFIPRERLVLEVNSYFENALNECAYSDTFNAELLALPGYRSTPTWQGFGVTDPTVGVATVAASFDQTSKIDVSVEAGDVSKSGIVAFMADRYAVMHTIRRERIGVQRFDVEDVDLYFYQNRDSYIENLGQNALVFTVEAPSA